MIKFQLPNRAICVPDDHLKRTIDMASRAAKTHFPVLICGESGTGKELVARYIHQKSERASQPFVSLNCAAIPEGLLEAELFGFEKGAFTGAVHQRIGKFEKAQRGTLLLDEVSEMPTHLQAKLLRVLQEGEVDRLGGSGPVPIHCRIIATSNKEPLKLIKEGTFRADLYYRLNVVRIDCQSLRGRKEAISNLAKEFLATACESFDGVVKNFSPAAITKLVLHPWPGNVRELKNAIERATLLCESNLVEPDHLDLRNFEGEVEETSLGAREKEHILKTLNESSGNRTLAAERLGISVRTLRNKIQEYKG